MSTITTITSPSAALMPGDHTSYFGDRAITFRDGIAKVEDISDALKGYFEANGFGVDGGEPKELPAPAEPADPRDVTTVEGSPLRDAAVDPHADDFLAPTNAGDGNPHGSAVVSPGIHGNQDVRPIKAGDVTYAGDTDAQSAAEVAHTEAAHDGTPVSLTDEERDVLGVTNTVDAGDPDSYTVPDAADAKGDDLDTAFTASGLSLDANASAEDKRTALELHAVPSGDLRGADLDDALALYGLPRSGTADEKRAAVEAYRQAQVNG